MIGKTSILQNIESLERLYNRSTSTNNALFNSKLVILDLCGWIEESMDDIVQRCANRNLKDLSNNRSFVEKTIIRRTYGFDYHNNFRSMIMQVIGLINLEKVEKRVDQKKFQLMKSALDSLKTSRNQEAHTHLKGITRRLDAPSVTKQRFIEVYEGLKSFESELRRLI